MLQNKTRDKKEYESPKANVFKLAQQDVVTASKHDVLTVEDKGGWIFREVGQ